MPLFSIQLFKKYIAYTAYLLKTLSVYKIQSIIIYETILNTYSTAQKISSPLKTIFHPPFKPVC